MALRTRPASDSPPTTDAAITSSNTSGSSETNAEYAMLPAMNATFFVRASRTTPRTIRVARSAERAYGKLMRYRSGGGAERPSRAAFRPDRRLRKHPLDEVGVTPSEAFGDGLV
ncbi:hypothetical protein GCM10028858_12770 [Halorubrum pallidum]